MATKIQAKGSKQNPVQNRISLADLWDETDSSEASNSLPAGEHEVRLNGIELKEDPKKGAAAFAEYECIEGDNEGHKVRQMYKLTDSEGSRGPGMAYLMRDLELLGFSDINGKKLPKTLKSISEDQPMVIVNVKLNGQYTNAYLQGPVEDAGQHSGNGKSNKEEDDEEINVGDTVTDGSITGEVVKINQKKGTALVTDSDGDEHTLDLDDLEKADPDDQHIEDPEIEVGSYVTDGDLKGEVKKINEKKGTATIVDEDGDTFNADLSDLTICEKEEEQEAEVEIEVGNYVEWTDDDIERKGEVKKIDAKKQIAVVEDEDGDKHRVDLDELTIIEKEEEQEAEIEVGSRVKWTDSDGDDFEGEITKLKGDIAIIEDDDGDKHKVEVDELELA